jgi:hypothetical protein
MKKNIIIYWITTSIIGATMLASALYFAFSSESTIAFQHLGLPHWFKIELTVAKLAGVLALMLPRVHYKLKEFAYFGFAIVLLSTPVAHLSSGDSAWLEVFHSFFFATLVTSYIYFNKTQRQAGAH